MLISPRKIGASSRSSAACTCGWQQGALDHVRFRQHQLWSSSSAILTFDGVMTAALASAIRAPSLPAGDTAFLPRRR